MLYLISYYFELNFIQRPVKCYFTFSNLKIVRLGWVLRITIFLILKLKWTIVIDAPTSPPILQAMDDHKANTVMVRKRQVLRSRWGIQVSWINTCQILVADLWGTKRNLTYSRSNSEKKTFPLYDQICSKQVLFQKKLICWMIL